MVETTVIQQLLETTRPLGFYDFLLPWLLFFALIFGLLQRIQLFKGVETQKQINVIISVVISFFIVEYVPPVATLATLLTNLFGTGALILAGMLVAILFLGMVGVMPGEEKLKGIAGKFVISLLVLMAIIVFLGSGIGAALATMVGFPTIGVGGATMDMPTLMTIVLILAILAVIIWLAKGPSLREKALLKQAEAAGKEAVRQQKERE